MQNQNQIHRLQMQLRILMACDESTSKMMRRHAKRTSICWFSQQMCTAEGVIAQKDNSIRSRIELFCCWWHIARRRQFPKLAWNNNHPNITQHFVFNSYSIIFRGYLFVWRRNEFGICRVLTPDFWPPSIVKWNSFQFPPIPSFQSKYRLFFRQLFAYYRSQS